MEEIFIDAFQTRTYTTAAFEQHVETTYMPNMAIHGEKLTITIHRYVKIHIQYSHYKLMECLVYEMSINCKSFCIDF